MRGGIAADAGIINAPNSVKNEEKARGPEMKPINQLEETYDPS